MRNTEVYVFERARSAGGVRGRITISNFRTKPVLSLRTWESVRDIRDKNSEYDWVILGYIRSLLDTFPVFFCWFGTKMGLSSQLSAHSQRLEVMFFSCISDQVHLSYIVRQSCAWFRRSCVFIPCKNSFFLDFPQMHFFGLDYLFVLTGSIISPEFAPSLKW